MKRAFLLCILLCPILFSQVAISVIQQIPDSRIAGSIYYGNYSFTTNTAGFYNIYVSIANSTVYGEAQVFSQNACVEYLIGYYNCTNSMTNGLNYANLSLAHTANLDTRLSYPIKLQFSIPYFVADAPGQQPAYYSGSGGSGGGEYAYPRPAQPKPTAPGPEIQNKTEVPIEEPPIVILPSIPTTSQWKAPNRHKFDPAIILPFPLQNITIDIPAEPSDDLTLYYFVGALTCFALLIGVGGVIFLFKNGGNKVEIKEVK